MITEFDLDVLKRARRLATRKNSRAACISCKALKVKCNEFRPCVRCKGKQGSICFDAESRSIHKTNGNPSQKYEIVGKEWNVFDSSCDLKIVFLFQDQIISGMEP